MIQRLMQKVFGTMRECDCKHLYNQLEAVFSIYRVLDIRAPLPTMRDPDRFAVAPDMGALIVSTVLMRRPQTVLDIGSGVSTLLIAYALEKLGAGNVIALEHDARFAETTRQQILEHGLDAYATVLLAPLVPLAMSGRALRLSFAEPVDPSFALARPNIARSISAAVEHAPAEERYLWYDLAAMSFLAERKIDMAVVDGPPQKLHPFARYPALPILWPLLAKDAVLLLDDFKTDAMRQTVVLWQNLFRELDTTSCPTEKGTAILKKTI